LLTFSLGLEFTFNRFAMYRMTATGAMTRSLTGKDEVMKLLQKALEKFLN
jgi:DNA-binding transcriptional regulator PaaX